MKKKLVIAGLATGVIAAVSTVGVLVAKKGKGKHEQTFKEAFDYRVNKIKSKFGPKDETSTFNLKTEDDLNEE